MASGYGDLPVGWIYVHLIAHWFTGCAVPALSPERKVRNRYSKLL